MAGNEQENLNEQKYKAFFETINFGVVYQDASGYIISANPAAEKSLGLSIDQMQGRTSMDPRWRSMHEDGSDFPGDTHPAMVALQTGEEVSDVVMGVFSPHDDQVHWISINAVPLFKPGEKKPYQVYTTFEDVTERKRLDEALRQKTFDLSERVKEISCLYLISTLTERPDFSREDVFEEVLESIPFGWQYPEITCVRIVAGEQEYKTANFVDNAAMLASDIMAGGKKTGSIEIGYIEAKPDSDEGPFLKEERSLINAIVRLLGDYVERKRAEEALKEKTDFLDKIIESSALSMWISDEKGTAIRANPACLKFFGAAEEEVVGKYNLFKDAVIEKQGFMPVIKGVFEKGEAANIVMDYDFAAVDHVDVKDATHKTINSVFTPVLDSNGKVSNVIVQTIDLTEMKQAEEALKKSEERFRDISGNMADWVCETDADGEYTYASGKVEEVMGYKTEELLGETPFDFMPEDEAVRVLEIFKKIVSNKEPIVDLENWNIAKNGDAICLLTNGIPLLNENGVLVGYRGVDKDITERKRAEEALQEIHENFQMVVSNITVAVWSADIGEDGAFENTYTSTVFDELLGLPAGTLKNDWNKYFSYVKPEYMERINIAFAKAIESPGAIIEIEFEVVKDNGQTAWLYSRGRCFEKNGKLHVFGSTADITERKQAEEEITKLAKFPSENPNPVLRAGDDGTVIYANEAGTPLLEHLGCRINERLPQDWREKISDSLKLGVAIASEVEYQNKVMSMTIAPMFELKQVNIYGLDITERKHMEEKLKGYSENLEKMVEERTAELKSAHEKLLRSGKLAAIGQFSAGVAHDLRNPLNIMYNAIYLLRLKLGDGDEKINRLLSMLEAETKKSNDIIGRVMDFARTEEPQMAPINIHKVIDAALSGILIPVDVEVVLDDISSNADLPAALVDSAQIARVFSNIVINAVQAMPDGGKLTINAKADVDSIITEFEDTGVGIAAEHLDKIFEPLFTTKHKTGGTGIGLAASKAIVEAHKGDIEVRSREGKGTTILIKLPAKIVTKSA